MPDVAVVDAPLDTNIVVDAGMDGGMTCGGQWKSPFSYGSLLHAWNFDEGASPIKDSVGLKTMLVPGYSFVQSDNKACKWALTLDGMNQAATQATAGVGISASMVVNVPANQAGVPILYGLGATYGGWSIAFVNNGNGTVSPEITIDHTIQQSATSGHKIPTDGSSHLLEITMAGTTAAFAVDGSAVETVSTQVGIADDQALFFGTSSKIVIDELRIYKGATW